MHGGEQVIQTQSSIQNLAQEVEVATDVIQELEVHGNSISTILSTIQDIAEQTNLLALNALLRLRVLESKGEALQSLLMRFVF